MLKAKGRCRACGGDGGSAMNERLQAALAELPFWPNLTEPQRELARRGARLAQYDRGALMHGATAMPRLIRVPTAVCARACSR